MVIQFLMGAMSLADGPTLNISLVELGIVSGLVAILFTILKWSTNRFLLGTVDKLLEATKTADERMTRLEKELMLQASHSDSIFQTKEDGTKLLIDMNRRLDKYADTSERLQIAVAELAILLKETRDEYKEILKRK